MIAIELKTSENADNFYNQLNDNGYLVGFKDKTIIFMPPLIIDRKEIDNLIRTIDIIITGTYKRE